MLAARIPIVFRDRDETVTRERARIAHSILARLSIICGAIRPLPGVSIYFNYPAHRNTASDELFNGPLGAGVGHAAKKKEITKKARTG